MLHILVTVWKWIGILFVSILGLTVLFLCLLLFVPIRYKIYGEKSETDLSVSGAVNWLFGAVSLRASWEKKEFHYKIRIFGISFDSIQSGWNKIRSFFSGKKRNMRSAKTQMSYKEEPFRRDIASEKDQTAIPLKGEENTADREMHMNRETSDDRVDQLNKNTDGDRKKCTDKKVHDDSKDYADGDKQGRDTFAFLKKIVQRIKNIGLTISSICDKINSWRNFLQEEAAKEALVLVKKELYRILKHILPRKMKGTIRFGFEDPSKTGQLLGAICVFYPLYYEQINIYPDFTQNIFLGDFDLKGRIYVVVIAFVALKVYFNKNIQYVINHLTSEKGNKI